MCIIKLAMFESMLKFAKEVAQNIERVNEIAVKQSSGKMIDKNEEQLDKSILNTGQSIVPKYAPSYAKKKGFKDPDLKVTGAFRRSIFVDINMSAPSISFDATDYKTPFLKGKYGEDILGNTKQNAEEVFEEVYEKDWQYISKQASKYL